MPRIKPAIAIPKTREEAESIVGAIAELKINEAKTKAEMDQELKEIRTDYEQQLSDINTSVTPLLLRIQAWAEANQDEFGKQKSIAMLHGTIGWRVGNPTLKTLSGWTWDRCLEALKSLGWLQFIRSKPEVDKAAILNQRETLTEADLRQIGTRVVQEESFFVEPKMTETEKTVSQ